MQQHNYIVKGLIDYEGRPVYEIRFDQKDGVSIYLVTRIDTGQLKPHLEGKLIPNNEAIEANAKKNSSRQDNFWENYNSIEADFNVDSVLRVMRH